MIAGYMYGSKTILLSLSYVAARGGRYVRVHVRA